MTLVVEALVLDMDETINRTGRAMRTGLWQASRALWPRLGNEERRAHIEDYVADRSGWFDRFSSGRIDFETMRRGRLEDLAAALGEWIDEERRDRFESVYRTVFAESCAPWPDALALLERAAGAGVPVAVLSNSSQAMTMMKVHRLALAGRFTEVFASDELPAGKPDPVAYRTACARLGVEPERVGYADDSLRDARGAALAGLQAVWLDRAGDGGAADGLPAVTSLDQLHLRRAAG